MYVSQSGRSTLTPSSSDLIRGSRHYKFNPSCLQTGRSMVEMLGVLAIVGVLSVTGIIGYTIAMRKYRANEIAQAISSMAIAAKTANGGLGIKASKNYKELLHRDEYPIGVTVLQAIEDSDGKFKRIELQTDTDNLCIEVESIIGDSNKNALYIASNDGCDNNGTDKLYVTVTD